MKRVVLSFLLLVLCFSASLVLTAACPTICVMIPEHVIIRLIPTPVPDPAAETAIINAFLQYGFNVVDPNQIRAIRYATEDWAARAKNGDAAAIAYLSSQFAADILIVGEAFAEEDEQPGQLTMQAARARVELRAIETATGRILAAESFHTGGVDLGLNTAAKRALQRAGERIAPILAAAVARYLPSNCRGRIPPPEGQVIGIGQIVNQSQISSSSAAGLVATMLATEMSKLGYPTVHGLAADILVTGTITNWQLIMTPAINIPGLDVLIRTGVAWMTIDVQVNDLATGRYQAFDVTQRAAGIEILGMRFGFGERAIIRNVCKGIASRLSAVCRSL